MIQNIPKLWHDPVWSKVIAGIILAIGSFAAVYFLSLLTAVKSFAALCIEFAFSTTAVPNLILIIVGFLSIPTVLLILYVIKRKILPSRQETATSAWWNSYTSDLFFGLRWRWKYSGNEHEVYNVTTYCPKCDYQVFHARKTVWDTPIAFYCDCCNQQLTVIDETYAALESKTIRHIHQKIRNGTWVTQNTI